MAIPVTCECGKGDKVKDELAGKKVRCAVCKALIAIPRLDADEDGETEALKMLLTEEPARSRKPNPPPTSDSIQSEPPPLIPKRASRFPEPEPKPRRPKPVRPRRS